MKSVEPVVEVSTLWEHLFPEAFLFSSLKWLQLPREPLNAFKAEEITAETKQAAVGGDDSTYMVNVIFFRLIRAKKKLQLNSLQWS